MIIEDTLELYFLCLFDIANAKQIEAWADNQFAIQNETNIELLSLYNKDLNVSRGAFISLFLDFKINTDINDQKPKTACIKIFKTICESYLKKEISPFQFCLFINRIEMHFLHNTKPDDLNNIVYPYFLGDLFNACDWCDTSWTHDNSQHINKEIIQILSNL